MKNVGVVLQNLLKNIFENFNPNGLLRNSVFAFTTNADRNSGMQLLIVSDLNFFPSSFNFLVFGQRFFPEKVFEVAHFEVEIFVKMHRI